MSAGPMIPQTAQSPEPAGLIAVHIAEYEALMTRNTYWITIQFSVAPGIAVFLAMLAAVWNVIRATQPTGAVLIERWLLWSAILGTELFVIAGYMCLDEMYKNITYIESYLRPELKQLLQRQDIWMYETYLAKKRGFGALINEWWPVPTCLVALLLVIWHAWPWNTVDFRWFALCLIASVVMVGRASQVTKVRRGHFQDSDTSVPTHR